MPSSKLCCLVKRQITGIFLYFHPILEAQYESGIQRYNEEQQRLKQHEAEAKAKEEYVSKIRHSVEDPKMRGAYQQPTDILKAFAPDTQAKKPPEQGSRGKGGMTAACLIDAIIVHQINQSTEESSTTDTQTTKSAMGSDQKPVITQSTMSTQQQQQQQHQQQQQQQIRHVQQQPGGPQPYPQGDYFVCICYHLKNFPNDKF